MPVFVKDFTEVDLIDNILFVEHNLSDSVIVVVYDDTNKQILPDEIEIINSNSLKIHLQSFTLRNASYKASVFSVEGEDGATFTPVVSQATPNTVTIDWTNDKGLLNPQSVTVEAPKGDPGETPALVPASETQFGVVKVWVEGSKGYISTE